MKRLLVFIMALCLIVSSASLTAFAAGETLVGATAPAADEFDEIKSSTPVNYVEYMSYKEYLEKHGNEPTGSDEIEITAKNIVAKSAGVKLRANYDGFDGTAIYTGEEDFVEFKFNATAGKYTLLMEYHTEPGKNVSIERALYVNGEIPFDSAEDFTFPRVWKDDLERDENGNYKFTKDIFGNGIVPDQVEVLDWTQSYFCDSLGFYSDPLEVSFKNGVNTLKLESVKEPMSIGKIILMPAQNTVSYKEYLAECENNSYKNYADDEIIIEAENAYLKSDQTLYPAADVGSPSTSVAGGEQNAYLQQINFVGGTNWQYSQQAISWKIPDSVKPGMYRVNFKVRKNVYQGMISSRKLYINDKVPFAEAGAIAFKYSDDWTLVSPMSGEEECLVYLQPGDMLKLEVTSGEMGAILQDSEEILNEINTLYRQIIMITGSSPDTNRDYQLNLLIPEVIKELGVKADEVLDIVDRIVKFTGKKGSDMSSLEALSRQMRLFCENPDKISKQLGIFKSDISSFGTWLNSAKEAPLEIDYISLSSPEKDKSPKAANVNFFANLGYEFNRFVSSFVVDYNAIGTTTEIKDDDKTVTVWIASGRDQYQQLRALINNSYTAETGNQVNLELVNTGALLSAVVAGIGPDVILGQPKNEPVNYALRNAIYPLTEFKELEEVKSRFTPEALVPFYFYNGKTTDLYALPETQDFYMLFYRKDVLAELGLGIPNTWDQLIQCITVLNKNNMEFGLPSSVMMFYTFLLQEGGQMYKDDVTATDLKSAQATKAFKLWTNFFVNYDCPKAYDFKNRFRTGEMPLGIESFTLYNTLAVSAPEIRGLWGFTSVPGTVKEDGTLDRSDDLNGACCFILKDNINPQLSWEFLKWWTDKDTQSAYGNRLECVLGASARYNTANIEAFQSLPWTSEEIGAMKTQLTTCHSLAEIPGSYFLSRHLLNAYRKVVYSSKDARDTLFDYSNVIDAEITKKRAEFGLPTASE